MECFTKYGIIIWLKQGSLLAGYNTDLTGFVERDKLNGKWDAW